MTVLDAHARKEFVSKKQIRDAISDISHQIKTPLAALNLYNEIIKEEASDETIKEFTKLSEQELDRIETLIQKITKFDTGLIQLNREEENLFELMDYIKQRFLLRATREGKELILSRDNSIYFECDCDWIIEAISNVVKNAMDHTKVGDTIFIEWKRYSSIIQVSIKDNEEGIHPEDLHHNFKRFYRSRFSQDKQGIGLGLPLSRSTVEAHGGTIEVDSDLGNGTSIFLDFLIPTKL